MVIDFWEMMNRKYDRCALYDRPDWYDFDYIGYAAEAPFYHGLISRGLRPNQVFVELGAGSGRLLINPLGEGVKCHAVEPNAHMLQACVATAQSLAVTQTLTSECARADNFKGPPDGEIGLIGFPFNGLLHLYTTAELERSLRHVYQRLLPEGRFACDIMSPAWEVMEAGSVDWGRLDERVSPRTGATIWTYDRCWFEPATHLMHSELRFIGHEDIQGVELFYAQRMWTYQEVLGCMEKVGFEIDEVYGDVDFAAFDENSPRLLISAAKSDSEH